MILYSFFSCALFVILMPRIFNYVYNSVPHLDAVPEPSITFDPNLDIQSEKFADEDVRAQLVPASTHSIHAQNPATGDSLGHVRAHTPDDVPALVAKARKAQESWSKSTFHQRRQLMRTLSNYILYNQRDICEITERDTGKTTVEASLGEILPTLEKLRWLVAEGESVLRPSQRTVGPVTMHKQAYVEYHPLGVVVAIAPWNYSLHNIFNPVSAALFAGCAVVVKPSEHTVWSGVHCVRIIRRALAICGADCDLVQCAVGGADVAQRLVKADVDKVFFTGSTGVGRKVAAAAAETLIPTCLELGGKDAFIVSDDADVKHAVTICMRGVYQNAGQNCIGVERVFLHKDIKERFTNMVVERVKQMRLGVDMGAITMGKPAIEKIQNLVDDATKSGAHLLTGGKQGNVEEKGWYYEPTVLTDVTQQMKIAHEEVFGPVMSIFEWKDDKDLIESVNDCKFGLGCSIFTGNKKRAANISKHIRVGMCNINDYATSYLCQSMPFGGTKQSGSDRFAGIEGLRGCCIGVSTTRDKYPGVRTNVPKALQYPVGANAPELTAEINDLMYGSGLFSKLDNLRQIVGMLLFPSWRPRAVGSG